MAVAYPTNLPIPTVTGYSHPDSQKVRRNDVETGPPRIELLSESGPSFPIVSWLFTSFDFQIFEGFYKHSLKFGSISFNMNLEVGAGLKLHECYFNKAYKPILQGKLWKVTSSLITVEKQYDILADFNEVLAIREGIEGDIELWINQFNNIMENILPDAF